MAQVFGTSGQANTEDGISYPALSGQYVPSVDNPQAVDGLGLTLSWGGGSTARKVGDESSYTSVGSSLTAPTMPIMGNSITYDVEGIIGPQGPQGPAGLPGSITALTQQIFVPYGNPDLNTVLAQLKDWDTKDTLIYVSDATVRWGAWKAMDVSDNVSYWADFAIDEDGSFMAAAAQIGIPGVYISADAGVSWALSLSGIIEHLDVSANGTKAVALENGSDAYGQIYVTDDSGENWAKVTLSV